MNIANVMNQEAQLSTTSFEYEFMKTAPVGLASIVKEK